MQFFRSLLGCATLAVSLGAQQTQSSEPLTDQRIMELVHAGVSAEELTRIIATAPSVSFYLTPAATDVMLKSGVSEDTIKAMAAREQHAPTTVIGKLPVTDPQS